MSAVSNQNSGLIWTQVDEENLGKLHKLNKETSPTNPVVLINIDTQRLHFVQSQQKISYLISTALKGVGQEEGSAQTPLGLHRIETKIGKDEKAFAIFKSRIPTGEIADPNSDEKFIVGRIFWLKGVEPGFNQGKNSDGKVVDTFDRYIYIHGTNDISNIGKAVSGGCIRMTPQEAVDLFDKVEEGTQVYIYKA